jgi:hypothetical protein
MDTNSRIMTMNTYIRLAVAFGLFALNSLALASPKTGDFAAALDAFVERSSCGEPKLLPAGKDHGEMASCVIGNGRTVVWEIEKSSSDDSVQRIRFTWFDFAVDDPTEAKRLSPHVDQAEAGDMLDAFLDVYAPCAKQQLRDGFYSGKATKTRNEDGLAVEVQHFHNPSLVERVVVLYPSSSK